MHVGLHLSYHTSLKMSRELPRAKKNSVKPPRFSLPCTLDDPHDLLPQEDEAVIYLSIVMVVTEEPVVEVTEAF